MLYLTLWLPNSLHVKRSPWARSHFSCRFHFKNVSYSSELHYDRKRQRENHKQSSCLRDRATFSRVNDFTVFWIIGLRLRKYNLPSKERQMGAKLNETLCIVTKFRELLENYFLTFVIPMCDNESPSESNHDKLFVESNLWRFPNFKRQLISMFCPSVFSLKIAMLNDIGKGAVTCDRKRQACTK